MQTRSTPAIARSPQISGPIGRWTTRAVVVVNACVLGCAYVDPATMDAAAFDAGASDASPSAAPGLVQFRCHDKYRYAIANGQEPGRFEVRLAHLRRGGSDEAEVCVGHESEPPSTQCRPLFGQDGTFPAVWTVDVRVDAVFFVGRADAVTVRNDCATKPGPRAFIRNWSDDDFEATLWARRIGPAAEVAP